MKLGDFASSLRSAVAGAAIVTAAAARAAALAEVAAGRATSIATTGSPGSAVAAFFTAAVSVRTRLALLAATIAIATIAARAVVAASVFSRTAITGLRRAF